MCIQQGNVNEDMSLRYKNHPKLDQAQTIRFKGKTDRNKGKNKKKIKTSGMMVRLHDWPAER